MGASLARWQELPGHADLMSPASAASTRERHDIALCRLTALCSPLTPAFAECVNAKCTDTTSIEQARANIQTTCGCT